MTVEIVKLPNEPTLDSGGKIARPIVFLYGAERGQWQARAAKELTSSAQTIIRSDSPRTDWQKPAYGFWEMVLGYFEIADLIATWVGNGTDTLFVQEWPLVATAQALHGKKLLLGVENEPDHPMAYAIRFLGLHYGQPISNSLASLVAITQERCRQVRTVGR